MEGYLKTRAERWLSETSLVFRKWNITQMFDETGKSISLNASGVPTIKPVERVVVDTKHPHRVYFEQVGSSTPYQQHFISSVLS